MCSATMAHAMAGDPRTEKTLTISRVDDDGSQETASFRTIEEPLKGSSLGISRPPRNKWTKRVIGHWTCDSRCPEFTQICSHSSHVSVSGVLSAATNLKLLTLHITSRLITKSSLLQFIFSSLIFLRCLTKNAFRSILSIQEGRSYKA
jgi:hypothetical protein